MKPYILPPSDEIQRYLDQYYNQSEEIQLIPDKWGESVPFRCMVDSEEYDAFLYWNPSGKQAELKRMIGVNSK